MRHKSRLIKAINAQWCIKLHCIIIFWTSLAEINFKILIY